jgi:hypothetical protein
MSARRCADGQNMDSLRRDLLRGIFSVLNAVSQ